MVPEDYVVVITGAASGIGLETARQFIQQGAKVIGVDMDETGLKKAQEELGKSYIPQVCNISQWEDIEQAAKNVEKNQGHVDVLVNNAGVGRIGINPENLKESDYYYHYEVLVKGPMLMGHFFVPLLMKSTHGPSIVNIGSVVGRVEMTAHFIYSSAKAAVEKITKCWVRDLQGIRVNCVLPGWINTPIWRELELPESDLQALFQVASTRIPCARIGQPEDIANCILFLASPQASYINGASIVVDGGFQFYATW